MQNPLFRFFSLAILVLMLGSSENSLAQSADQNYISYKGFSFNYQAYDLQELNAKLSSAGYSPVEEEAMRVDLFTKERGPGRWRASTSVYLELLASDGNKTSSVNGVRAERSVDMFGFGVSIGVDYDLLYPSAWNLYVGIAGDVGANRLKTTQVSTSGSVSPFNAQTTENKFNFLVLGLRPQLTLESFEFGGKGGWGRLFVAGGYRFAANVDLFRNVSEDSLDISIDPSGVNLQFGVLFRPLK